MKKKFLFCLTVVIVISFSIVSPRSHAGKLDKFEKELEKKEAPKEESRPGPKPSYRKLGEKKPAPQAAPACEEPQPAAETTAGVTPAGAASQSLMQILASFFLAGIMQTAQDNPKELYLELKEEWSPALPTIRVEPSYQFEIDKIHGFSGRVEAGYLMIGADGEYLQYFESGDDLKFISGHVLLRGLFSDLFGTNVAVGARTVWGNNKHTGFDMGVPFYVYLGKHFIFDIQPFIAIISGNNVYDIGGGVSYKYKLFGARAGYRVIEVGGTTLQGPRAGLFLQW